MHKKAAFLILALVMAAPCMLATGCDGDDPVAVDTPAEDYREIPLMRTWWTLPSQPIHGRSGTVADAVFGPSDRVETIRWFRPKEKILRRYLDPDLEGAERDMAQHVMEIYLAVDGDQVWDVEDWGGVMSGLDIAAWDISHARYLEFWVNDGEADPHDRSGRIHIDFGEINEDGCWPGGLVGTQQDEDANRNGYFEVMTGWNEDTGLGEITDGHEYSTEYDLSTGTYPYINSMRGNRIWDREDLNHNGFFATHNQYFTVTIDLHETPAEVDVLLDYTDVQELRNMGQTWRKYRIPLGSAMEVSPIGAPDLAHMDHIRLWFEDDWRTSRRVRLQLSELRFSW
ncbi:MAG: hypothetical protein GY838_11680 [bacterium]|nr:hypothetical protein [bacterium]